MSQRISTYKFQTEARQILDLMIHSVYSNKDIFLRELVSNASDALDKLRLQALTNQEFAPLVDDLHIRIEKDENKHSLAVIDNGIGMNREEIREFIGTIARSGTREYLELIRGMKDRPIAEELIGQFGVGFYSSFMVSRRVTLISRKAGEEKAWKWCSKGDGSYTLEETSRDSNGTTVILELFDEEEEKGIRDYTDEWVIRTIIRKYSDFIAYPIKFSSPGTDEKGEKIIEDKVLNSMKALWMKDESKVSNEEYNEFYRHITHDWTDPMHRFSFSMEGVTEFRGLLYIPSKAPSDLFFSQPEEGIHLYIKRVFIMNDCRALIPDYLRFVRGVIDSEDLPLNVSREILQDDPRLTMIRKNTTRRVLRELKKIMDDDTSSYLGFWKEFGSVLKEGILQDRDNHETILDLSLFRSTVRDEPFPLGQYIERMKEGQEGIYYLSGQEMEKLKNAPAMEAFNDAGFEVLLLTDPIDEIIVNTITSFREKPFLSVTDGRITPKGRKEDMLDGIPEEKKRDIQLLVDQVKQDLNEKVEDVRISERLTNSMACLVTGHEKSVSPKMQKILKAMGQEVPHQKRILEVNPDHPVINLMADLVRSGSEEELLKQVAYLIYEQAVISEGGEIEDPAHFSRDLSNILFNALRKGSSGNAG
ncbi:MAG: molecular chaperone HtpG [Synergistales bacterium]|nr:molecular chaperone HtpG [Synergistales bacterium]